MTGTALIFTGAFTLIALFLSMWRKLDMEKDILISTIRSTVQLFAIGYILHVVFNSNHPLVILAILLTMMSVAAWNASHRAKGIRGALWRSFASIAITASATMGLLLVLGIVQPAPQVVIPISGMIIGNSMVVTGLFFNQMRREVTASRGEIETLLSLGASAKQAIHTVLKRAVKASMIPTIDNMKTIGLVQLPGMMTGMIVAGADPVQAVKYQILIVLTFIASAAATAILHSVLSYKLWFTADLRLK